MTIATWEVKRFSSSMSRDLLPLVIVLVILLVLVSGYTAQHGLHLQDQMYRIGIDSPVYLDIVGQDPRYAVYPLSEDGITQTSGIDVAISKGTVLRARGQKAEAAQKSLEHDYQGYQDQVFRTQTDLFAAYPVWVKSDYIVSELDFLATQGGRQVSTPTRATPEAPVPEGTVEPYLPDTGEIANQEDLRIALSKQAEQGDETVGRYSGLLAQQEETMGDYRIPSMLSPPLPFDTIIFIFIFIFPLYFTSQFFMMSIMNERTLRQGEALVASPVRPAIIIFGKMLPYAIGMVILVLAILFSISAPLSAIPPLIPVILFFLAFALFIGIIARSYKELSFISIFFSTIATSYLFFPSIFANIHIVSLLSPITLVIHALDGTGYTETDYLYATSLFYLVSLILFTVCIKNFHEEQIFTEKNLFAKISSCLGSMIPAKTWPLSLLVISALTIPFVFMAQMMYLVLFFNLPMPASLIMIMILAALTEEIAKAAGLIGLINMNPDIFSWKVLGIAAIAIAAGFLLGEKLLLFITLSQISDSVFGAILFLSLGLLWMPFLLHAVTVFCTGLSLKFGGTRSLPVGIALATMVHCTYNLILLRGWAF